MSDEEKVQMCSVEGCGQDAVAHYRWPWGDEGLCCARHQFLLKQQGENMGRAVQFSPLPARAPKLGRDERAMLLGKNLANEAEITELKMQLNKVYSELEDIRSSLRAAEARKSADKVTIQQLQKDVERAEAESTDAIAKLTDAQDEVRRLRALLPKPAPPTP